MAGVVAALVLAAGCSSATPSGAPVRARAPGEPRSPDQAAPVTQETAPGASAGGAVAHRGAPTATTRSERAGSAAAPTRRLTGRGVTDTTIKIGVYYYDRGSATAAAAAFGASGVSVGDTRGFAQAVIDDINAHGGVAGRRLEPVFFARDVSKTVAGGEEAQAQAACNYFTQDNKVFAVVQAIGGVPDVLLACLAKQNTPLIADNLAPIDARLLNEFADFVYLPSVPNLTRELRFEVDVLYAQGFYGKGAKVGLIRADFPSTERAAKEGLRPALAAHGLVLAEEAAVTFTNEQGISAAVLRFKSMGITHVHIIDQSGAIGLAVLNNAESQQYHPRYELSSDSAPSAVLQANVPAAQLRGAMGAGWIPTVDVTAARDPGASAAKRGCLDLVHRAGMATPDRFAETFAMWACDSLYLLRTALAGPVDITPAGLRRGVEGIGPSFAPAATFAASFGAARHDGTSAVRPFGYVDACACFQYLGPVQATG